MRLQLIICHKKELLSVLSSIKLMSIPDTKQVLPGQMGLYRYDDLMVQDINDKNLNRS